MNSKIEDLPTPASPIRRMVCGSLFEVLMIPFLRDSTSLEKDDQVDHVADVIGTYLRLSSLSSSKALPCGREEPSSKETLSLERSVDIDRSGFRGKTRG